jgi:Double zinc ribbon/Sel1 repeat
MQCTFCGTENRPEYKFCGMCGVKLERRQNDRRARQSGGATVKCPACGHSVEPGLKFCGMCGTRTERRVQERRGTQDPVRAALTPERATTARSGDPNAQLPTPDASKIERMERPAPAATATVDVPPAGIRRSGEPAVLSHETRENELRRNELHNEPRRNELRTELRNEPKRNSAPVEQPISGPSFLGLNAQPAEGDGEYLLEDEPSRGGLRKVLLVVVILAILGLIFMQWRSSFKASPKPPPSKAEPASTPAGENRSPAGADPSAKDPSAKDPGSPSNANDGPAAKDPSSTKAEAESPIASVVPNAAAAPTSSPAEPADSTTAPAETGAATKETEAKPPVDPPRPDTKPSAALLRAQQFLQGRGVPQNCEQGLLYLKAATDKGDPGAAIQMAALYSSGHCVKQDRVMAYRWFNSAHELEPANMWIQKNMDQLWGQMTAQERRLAGY